MSISLESDPNPANCFIPVQFYFVFGRTVQNGEIALKDRNSCKNLRCDCVTLKQVLNINQLRKMAVKCHMIVYDQSEL